MSKRKAEDILSCCPASKRFISLFVNPLLSRGRTKRKLHEAELGPQPDYKRVEGGSRGPNPWERGTGTGAGGPRERRDSRLTGFALAAARPPSEIGLYNSTCFPVHTENVPGDEVSSQYNSFQFWRVPLPKIELDEIEDIGDMKIVEEMNCDIPEEETEIEMELQN
ncbi:uncharacterized protein C9orf40 homolog isoform X1 [Hypanus sabinus]|uniref:uncharacterized protein C9orf40 homolog isoform X1 n=1 Tax=Hypanus sabinus TaxID=79690 RepID=UPI0028C3C5CC|nr:uncharacterized protein C9orf40 homolog isoform X1 [Hypanus sabinus]